MPIIPRTDQPCSANRHGHGWQRVSNQIERRETYLIESWIGLPWQVFARPDAEGYGVEVVARAHGKSLDGFMT